MTTNGSTFRTWRTSCATPACDRVNISLDTLDREKFLEMTRRDELVHVLDGIEAAKEAGFDPVKINAVVERGVNDDEIVDLAAFARDHGVEMRFIEFMPLDADRPLDERQGGQPGRDRRRAIAAFPLEPVPARGAAPADRWRYLDGAGMVGVIPRSPSRSVATATACGSPPTASSAPACSPPGRVRPAGR
jgi:cyclic pyranopterin phosphate synthase